jgi:dTDP-4-dehydrorhamnose 3,5-epimerase-like enzyme
MGFSQINNKFIKLPKNTNLFMQTYEKQTLPDGVVVLKLNVFSDDCGGWFKESLRVNSDGNTESLLQSGIEFKIRQSNVSYLGANAKRFWHLHPNTEKRPGQNEIWTTDNTLLLGLVDLRKDSKTYGMKSKIVISPEKAVYIPTGVAHGLINPNNYPVTLVYFTDQQFSLEDTQEFRIDPNEMPFDFVEPELM